MNHRNLLCALFIVIASQVVSAAPAQSPGVSMDVPLSDTLRNSSFVPAAATTPQESFGRPLTWLSLEQFGINFLPVCLPESGPGCITNTPVGGSFDKPDLAIADLPGSSARSLLCEWVTATGRYTLANSSNMGNPTAKIEITPYVVIESEVFNSPGFIDPATNLPAAGRLKTVLKTIIGESRTLRLGDMASERLGTTAACRAGFLVKQNLVSFGLTEEQATKVFQLPMRLRFGVEGSFALVANNSFIGLGIRVIGD